MGDSGYLVRRIPLWALRAMADRVDVVHCTQDNSVEVELVRYSLHTTGTLEVEGYLYILKAHRHHGMFGCREDGCPCNTLIEQDTIEVEVLRKEIDGD